MVAEKTPVSIANYTPLGAYIQIPFFFASYLAMRIFGYINDFSDFELFVLTHEGYFLFIPRLISALFGTLTILVIYKLSKEIFKDRKVALISAFLGASSFNLVHISHFGRPWAAALFLFVLSFYFSIKNRTIFSYISVGMSYGFHQVGLLAVPLILWLTKKRYALKNLVSISTLLFMLLIFSFLTLKTGLIESIQKDQSFLKVGKLAADILVDDQNLVDSAIRSVKSNLILFFSINFLVTDGIIFLFAILGMFKSFKEPIQKKLIYYIFGYFLFASLFFHPLPRYLLPIFLISIPFAAYALKNTFQKSNFILTILLFAASFNSLWWNYLYLRTPTFIQANDWINKNIAKEVPIAYVGGRFQTYVPSRAAIAKVKTVNEKYFKSLYSMGDLGTVSNQRNILYVSNFYGSNKLTQLNNAIGGYPVEFVVDYYLDQKESLYSLSPESFFVIAQFRPTKNRSMVGIPEPLFDASWNFPTNDDRVKVSMYSLERIGPYFDVLQLRN